MPSLVVALVAIPLACCLAQPSLAGAQWRAVPGADGIDADLASLRQDRSQVTVWLRWPGASAHLPPSAMPLFTGPRVHRTNAQAQFDCAARTVRLLAVSTHDSHGRVLALSSTPGPRMPVQGEALSWTYDALCEAARGARP